jgi:hypothetical protein
VAEEIKAPHYSYEDLRRQADGFLNEYHPAGTVPVPIEEIIEFQFRIDIVPTPGLHQLLETDGFVTSDLREIWVDEFVYDSRPGRYRFTLAHEIGHVVLHEAILQAHSFSTIDEWKAFVNSIPDKEHGWLEYQAYAFAGLIFVPQAHLATATKQCVDLIRGEGIDLHENWDFAWSRIAAFLAKQFEVSSAVIDKRLDKDNLRDTSQ